MDSTAIIPRVRIIDLERLWRWTALERTALTVGLVTFFITGYFGVDAHGFRHGPGNWPRHSTTKSHFSCVRSGYTCGRFPAALIPLFVVRCPRLLRRTALAYAIATAVSLVCFIVFPVTSERLRVHSATLEIARPSDWAVSVLYSLDPPYNLFPSLHLSIAALSAFSAWKAARLCRGGIRRSRLNHCVCLYG